MKNEALIIGGIAAAILLTKGKVGSYVGESTANFIGSTITGTTTGLLKSVTVEPYNWAQEQTYIPIVDQLAYSTARTLDFWKNPIENTKNFSDFWNSWENAKTW